MIVLLIIAAILALLLFLPVGVRATYDARGLTVRAVFGLIEFQIVPDPRRHRGNPEEKRQKKEKKKRKLWRLRREDGESQKALGAKLQDFLPLIKLGIQALGDLRTVFTIRKLHIRVTYGGEDAGAVAMNYGVAWGVCSAGASILTNTFRVRSCEIEPVLDYDCRDMRLWADASVTLTMWRMLAYLLHYGIKAMKILRKQKKEKAVQHESSSS